MTRPEAPRAGSWPPAAELRWAAVFAAVVMLLTCLPYLWGLAIRPDGYYYSGLLANPDDHNVYLSYVRQASEGKLLFTDLFTSEAQAARRFDIFFLALGGFARVTRLPLPVVYHVARIACGWLLLMAIYWLAAQALERVAARRFALALAAFGSGLGWLFRPGPGQPHPIDYGPGLVMPEAITFLSLLLNPLFCFSMFLIVATCGLTVHALHSGSVRSAVLAGLAALALGNVHTYDLIPVAALLLAYGIYLLACRRLTARGAALGLLVAALAAPAAAYQYWLLRTGDIGAVAKTVGQWEYSRSAVYVARGLGLPLALAAAGAARSLKRGAGDWPRLLGLWLVLGFALIHLPVSFQRKLAEGLHIPVCLLAAFAVEPLWSVWPARWRASSAAVLLVLVAAPSNLLFVSRAASDLKPPLYLRPDQRRALRVLEERAGPSDVLLCNPLLGNYAPSLTGMRVYLGHWSETLEYRRKVRELSWFLRADASDASRERYCREQGITYVLRDRSVYDAALYLSPDGAGEGGFEPERSGWLEQVHGEGSVSVYRVKPRGD